MPSQGALGNEGRDFERTNHPHATPGACGAGGLGRCCQGDTSPQPKRRLPACQPCVHPRRQISSDTSPDAIAPRHYRPRLLSTVQAFSTLSARLRCPLLTSAGRSGRIPPPSVLHQDTPQISRGKLSDRPCRDAGLIKHSPWVDGGLCGRVPTRPERPTPHIRFVSLAPHLRSTLPSDPTSR
jgi:hypothetical protein